MAALGLIRLKMYNFPWKVSSKRADSLHWLPVGPKGVRRRPMDQLGNREKESARFEDTSHGKLYILDLTQLRIVAPYNIHSGLAVIFTASVDQSA